MAKKLGIDPDALDKTIKDFNEACNSNDFDVMKLDGKRTYGLKPDKTTGQIQSTRHHTSGIR